MHIPMIRVVQRYMLVCDRYRANGQINCGVAISGPPLAFCRLEGSDIDSQTLAFNTPVALWPEQCSAKTSPAARQQLLVPRFGRYEQADSEPSISISSAVRLDLFSLVIGRH